MLRHHVVFLRIATMAAALIATFSLFKGTLGGKKEISVFETVYANCIIIMVSLCYYCVVKFIFLSCYPSKIIVRRVVLAPRNSDGSYLDLHQAGSTTEIVSGVPRLTIQNVWILVYGVGFIMFVISYCIVGLNPFCLACAGLACSMLGIDELICPRTRLNKLYAIIRLAALMTGIVSVLLVTVDLIDKVMIEFVSTLDLYSIVFGFCLPFGAQFLMVAVRDNRRYTLGSVVEVCEFGFPFTVFLGIFHLSVAYGQRYQMSYATTAEYDPPFNKSLAFYHWDSKNLSLDSILLTDGASLLFYCVAPLFVAPSLFAYTACVIEGSAIDPLLSISLALCVQYFSLCETSTLGIYGTVCCSLAIICRVLGEFTPVLNDFHPQSENTLLTQQVVWEREARVARETKELTQALEEGEQEEVFIRTG
jgi:hypothetical protein